jgi:isopenicillin N synthase-like dioxygenase
MNVKTVRYDSPTAARDFTQSLLETGFAVLTHHPVAPGLIESTFGEWADFFASEAKHAATYDPQTQVGYFPFRSENAKGYSQKDLKEFYHHYPTRKELPANTRAYTPQLFDALSSLGAELLQWVEANTPAEVRQKFPMRLSDMITDSADVLLRVLHYPPLTGVEEDGAVRAAAHEDINLITLLPAATAPGLEVKDMQGNWHEVSCDPGMIVINSGDMLKATSQGYYPSTTHRVVNPRGAEARKSRYSMPLFLHPRRDAQLTSEMTAGQYLDQRLREIGLLK